MQLIQVAKNKYLCYIINISEKSNKQYFIRYGKYRSNNVKAL